MHLEKNCNAQGLVSIQHKLAAKLVKKEETQNLSVKKNEAHYFCLGEAELSGKNQVMLQLQHKALH